MTNRLDQAKEDVERLCKEIESFHMDMIRLGAIDNSKSLGRRIPKTLRDLTDILAQQSEVINKLYVITDGLITTAEMVANDLKRQSKGLSDVNASSLLANNAAARVVLEDIQED